MYAVCATATLESQTVPQIHLVGNCSTVIGGWYEAKQAAY